MASTPTTASPDSPQPSRRGPASLFRATKPADQPAAPVPSSPTTMKGLRTRVVSVIRRDSTGSNGSPSGKRSSSPARSILGSSILGSSSLKLRRTDSRSSVVSGMDTVKARSTSIDDGPGSAMADPATTLSTPGDPHPVGSDVLQQDSEDKDTPLDGEDRTTAQRKRSTEDADDASTTPPPAPVGEPESIPRPPSPMEKPVSIPEPEPAQTPAPEADNDLERTTASLDQQSDDSKALVASSIDLDQDSFVQLPRSDEPKEATDTPPLALFDSLVEEEQKPTNPFLDLGEVRLGNGGQGKSVSFATDIQEISPSEYSTRSLPLPVPQPDIFEARETDIAEEEDRGFASTSYTAFDTAPVSYEWFEHVLPDTTYYYTLEAARSPTRTVVTTDADMRLPQIRRHVEAYLRTIEMPSLEISAQSSSVRPDDFAMPEPAPGPAHTVWKALREESDKQQQQLVGPHGGTIEVYLRRVGDKPKNSVAYNGEINLVTIYVRHALRTASVSLEIDELPDAERLQQEMAYWEFVELHPAHVNVASTSAPQEAVEALTWSYTDRLMNSPPTTSGSPFSDQECQELLKLLRALSDSKITSISAASTVILTRLVAKVHLRLAQWRHQVVTGTTHTNGIAYPPTHTEDCAMKFEDSPQGSHSGYVQSPFKRTLSRLFLTFICLGIPYLMLSVTRQASRYTDNQLDLVYAGKKSGEMVANAVVCLVGAIMASVSVTFLVLPGLEQVARTFAMASLLFSLASLAASLLVLPRRSSTSSPTVTNSLPAVLLAYSVMSFVGALVTYAIKGTLEHNPQLVVEHFGNITSFVIASISAVLLLVLGSSAWSLVGKDHSHYRTNLSMPRGYRALPS